MLKRAQEGGYLTIRHTNIRDFSVNKHQRVDDRPYGGGPGMVLEPEPVAKAIRSVRREKSRVIYLSPQGAPLNAKKCEELAKYEHLVLLCGHYEGVDERVIESDVDEEISIGDYVLTNGCAAAIVVVDSVSRFIPGVIGHPDAVKEDSFQGKSYFDSPHFTGPVVFEGREVPKVLQSGNHKEIEKFRRSEALKKTRRVRPDLIEGELL